VAETIHRLVHKLIHWTS